MPVAISSNVGSLETCNSQVDVIAADGLVSVITDRRGLFTVLDMTAAEADWLIWLLRRAVRRIEAAGGGESGTPRGGA